MQGIGVGIFGCNDLTKSLVPLLKEKGFNVNAIYGKTIQEAQVNIKFSCFSTFKPFTKNF